MGKLLLKARLREAEQPLPDRKRPRYSKAFLVVLGFIFVFLVAFAETSTDHQFGFSIFYAIPIFMVTQAAGMRLGMLAVLASTTAWAITDLEWIGYQVAPWIALVNTTIRFCLFSCGVWMLGALQREKKFARRDFLTGIPNRQAFFEIAGLELRRARRYARPISMAYLDCDKFKWINDHYGHQTGNRLLRVLASALEKNIRSTDIAARLGGDEFAFLMPEADYEAARLAVARLQKILIDTLVVQGWPTTLSFGVVTFKTMPASVEAMIEMADERMYTAKKSGKNSVCHEIFEEPPTEINF